MDATLDIRRAARCDLDELLAMQTASIRKLGSRYYDEKAVEGFITCVGTLDPALLDDGRYFAAYSDGVLVGSGGWSIQSPALGSLVAKGIMAASEVPSARESAANIRSIFVHPDWPRQGIGRQIMTAVERDIERAGLTRICLSATLAGVPLYHQLGYRTRAPMVLSFPNGGVFIAINMEKAAGACTAEGNRAAA